MFGTDTIPGRPTSKLVLISALLILPLLAGSFLGGPDAPMSRAPLGIGCILLMLTWACVFGVFRLMALLSFFGMICLIFGLVLGAQLLVGVLVAISSEPDRAHFHWSKLQLIHLCYLWPLVVGYLLSIDKDITEYRCQLANHRLKKDPHNSDTARAAD